MAAIPWLRQNKLTALLIAAVLFLLARSFTNNPPLLPSRSAALPSAAGMITLEKGGLALPSPAPIYDETAPTPGVKDRLVLQNSRLSLLVKNTPQTLEVIKTHTEGAGGYLVDSELSKPEEGGAGTISIRIPKEKLEDTLKYLRSLAVKVVSENLTGTDVTDQFVDNDARLTILERNKTRFEEIMRQATTVEEILQVQREIFNLQTQIDSLRGQQNYLAKSAQMVKITVFVSTDELALPYTPAQPWRPEAIFKQAVRSLLATLQQGGTLLIWAAVYAVLWVPLVLIGILLYRRLSRPGP